MNIALWAIVGATFLGALGFVWWIFRRGKAEEAGRQAKELSVLLEERAQELDTYIVTEGMLDEEAARLKDQARLSMSDVGRVVDIMRRAHDAAKTLSAPKTRASP